MGTSKLVLLLSTGGTRMLSEDNANEGDKLNSGQQHLLVVSLVLRQFQGESGDPKKETDVKQKNRHSPRLGAIPNVNTRPSKRRRVTWAAQEKPKLIIFPYYASGRDSGERAKQIAEANPNIPTKAIGQFARRNRQPSKQAGTSSQALPRVGFQREGIQIPFFKETNVQIKEDGPPTSNINAIIDLPAKENFQKFEIWGISPNLYENGIDLRGKCLQVNTNHLQHYFPPSFMSSKTKNQKIVRKMVCYLEWVKKKSKNKKI
ncbi:hypothetical protein Taro_028444 [Colocasia esculenta]|uniref:Uncharacterized protein n=1 Tax=Colocasia esculenta TaxID=4460 RepID=A0A843VL36_COLES|nr:hypothetical protein [Colocasia esculenta]